jgi:hypothetical protein
VVFDETQFPFLSAETAARLTIQSELVPDSDGAVIIQGCHHPTPPSPNTPSTPPLNAVGSATLSPNPSSSSPATHNSPETHRLLHLHHHQPLHLQHLLDTPCRPDPALAFTNQIPNMH